MINITGTIAMFVVVIMIAIRIIIYMFPSTKCKNKSKDPIKCLNCLKFNICKKQNCSGVSPIPLMPIINKEDREEE